MMGITLTHNGIIIDGKTYEYRWADKDTVDLKSFIFARVYEELRFIPTRIIYNPPVTICYFDDGARVVVRAGKNEKYDRETGVMACIMRRLFASRSAFLRLVESGYEQKAVG